MFVYEINVMFFFYIVKKKIYIVNKKIWIAYILFYKRMKILSKVADCLSIAIIFNFGCTKWAMPVFSNDNLKHPSILR